jgi:excisionase family DNA binding protein
MLLPELKSRNAPRARLLNELNPDPLLSLAEVRSVLGCSYSTLNKLLVSGALKKWQPVKCAQRKVRKSELQKFLAAGDAQHV